MRSQGAALVLVLIVAACDEPSSTGTPRDVRAPGAVTDLSAAVSVSGATVELSWTAPRDDFAHERADHYEIRYSHTAPFEWEQATLVDAPPEPLTPGSAQFHELDGALRGRDVYAMVRAVDAAANVSPEGNVAYIRVPGLTLAATCYHALTYQPLAGLDVLVTDRSAHQAETDSEGRVQFEDLAAGEVGVRIRRGTAPIAVHRLTDALELAGDVTLDYAMVPVQIPDSPLYPSILALLAQARIPTPGSQVLKKWLAYPIACYVPPFVNARGLDYGVSTARAMDRWNEITGLPLFVAVGSAPSTGVVFEFPPRSVMGIQNGITDHSNDLDGFPLRDRIRIVDDFSDEQQLYSIMLHELGHALRLAHLPTGFIMYGGQPLPPDITADEASLVRLMVRLPNPVNLGLYNPAP